VHWVDLLDGATGIEAGLVSNSGDGGARVLPPAVLSHAVLSHAEPYCVCCRDQLGGMRAAAQADLATNCMPRTNAVAGSLYASTRLTSQ
jgi:hypothetical protein